MSFDPSDRLLVFTPTESEQNLLVIICGVILNGEKYKFVVFYKSINLYMFSFDIFVPSYAQSIQN